MNEKVSEIRQRLEAWKSKANTCIDFNALDVDVLLYALDEAQNRQDQALEVIHRYGGIEGDHHRAWVIDQTVRTLTGDEYEKWVAEHCDGEDGPNTYDWDVGIPP